MKKHWRSMKEFTERTIQKLDHQYEYWICLPNAGIVLAMQINNFESALATWEKIYPRPHPTKAFVLFQPRSNHLKIGNETSAAGYYGAALKMYHESYGKKHPGIATVLNAIGS
jgi:hypothetical protein